ncbi:MAG TPA: hypothetical protein VHT03_01680 [Rhizomicrobium sp.]|jgi:hypothetical protein|nr:hypothetical protein [Rhizomicrobium sp.]
MKRRYLAALLALVPLGAAAQTHAQYTNTDGSQSGAVAALCSNGSTNSSIPCPGDDPTAGQYKNSDGSQSAAAVLLCPQGGLTIACSFAPSSSPTFTGIVTLPDGSTWNGTHLTDLGGIVINRSLSLIGGFANTGLLVENAATGTYSSGGATYLNLFYGTSDHAAMAAGGNTALLESFYQFGSAAMTGNRTAFGAHAVQMATTGNTGAGFAYSGITGSAKATANDNGTGTTAATARGIFQGVVAIGDGEASATDLYEINGIEDDVICVSGCSVYKRIGSSSIILNGNAGQGAVVDTAYEVGAQPGALGLWKYGYQLCGADGISTGCLDAAATAIGCPANCGTITNFADSSNFTITGDAWKSPGATIDGSGNIEGNNLSITATKVLTISNTLTLAGTDSSTLNIGSGGTLGSNAFNSTSYCATAGCTMAGTLNMNANQITNSGTFQSNNGNGAEIPNQSCLASATTVQFIPYKGSTSTGMSCHGVSGDWGMDAAGTEDFWGSSTAITIDSGIALDFASLPSGTPSTYACFTTGGQLISSATAC